MPEISLEYLQTKLAAAQQRVATLESGNGGGHDGGMDDVLRRVGALENDMRDVKAVLGRLEPMIARIDERTKDMPSAKDFGELRGRVGHMPTTFQMVSWFVGVGIGLTGLAFTIARLAGGQ